MSFLVRFAPASMTAEQYDAVGKELEPSWPPEGLELHVCFGSGDQLRVSEVWESREQMEAFGATLMPVLERHGIDVQSVEPEFHDVVSFEAFKTAAAPSG
ncbi:MAG: hypothetical protein QOF43_127 [Gaiellaceae bacterium]|nr:hypothetical protein [Gaiellaceae bacterium]